MIQVEDLCFRYPRAEQDAVEQLSFAIDPGEVFGFLGPVARESRPRRRS